nr:uncharacterized protein LOC126053965 [Helicoverpa armigera]
MPKCFLCLKDLTSVPNLMTHFSLNHERQNFSVYHCIEDDCNRSFHLRNTYRKHLYHSHATARGRILNSDSDNTHSENTSNISVLQPSYSHSNISLNFVEPPLETNKYALVHFISSLYANPLLPRNVIQDVVDGIHRYMCSSLTSNIESVFSEITTTAEQGNYIRPFKEKLLSIVKDECKEFDTEFKRLGFLEKQGTYIPPKKVVIGNRMCNIKERGVVKYKSVECTEQLIPLRFVLQNFFSLKGVIKETFDYVNGLNSNCLQNFVQGNYWRSVIEQYDGKLVFPLFMYFDDYETGNVLGTHSGIHKLGAVYVSVACMPPDRTSSLDNIFLALLFHSTDRIVFGNNVIFEPLIQELNFLSETGVNIDVPEYKGKLYFRLGLILGDNLGIHSIAGFNETFSSNFPCRICNVSKENLKDQLFENVNLLRNSENYNAQLLLNSSSHTGIKEKCVWLSVTNFSLFDQLGVDIMHDILEGVAKYIMSFIIVKYTSELKYFTFKTLNDRMEHFDFGPDSSSRPCQIITNNVIRLSASEMLSFVRYFNLLVGDYVPTDDRYWTLYLTLRNIINLLMSTIFNKEKCNLLQFLISELNELYIKLSNETLKPKFHFLVHYPSMILKFGPLVNFWSMRYEAKHRVSKISARANFNRRNITLSLAKKHQLQLNKIFVEGSLKSPISVGVTKRISKLDRSTVISYLNLDPSLSLVSVTWAKVKSILYKPGTILLHNVTGNYDDIGNVTFMNVNNLYIYNEDKIIFETTLLSTIDFNFHLDCFEVKYSDVKKRIYMFHDNLLSYVPCHINVTHDGKLYVTQRAQS